MSQQPRTVIMVAFEQAQILDVTGPMQVLSAVNDLGQPGYHLTLAAPDAGEIITTSGLRLGIDRAFHHIGDDELETLDTLLVSGGDGIVGAMRDPRQIDFLRRAFPRARRVASICSGVALLAQAGLVPGKRVATHWNACDLIGNAFPDLTIDRDAIFVRDGNLWTSAGVTAGMDLALALIEEDFGHDVAVQVARRHVLFMIRPGGQSQFSVQLEAQANEQGRLGPLLKWIADNPGEELTVPALAARACMTERTFARVFRAETGVTPAEFVERARTEAARRDLEHTSHAVDRIAFDCGFGSMERMRRTFLRRLGVGPKAYRDRFRRLQPVNPRREPMNIGIIIFDDAEELDFVGPWEVLTSSNNVFRFLKQPEPDRVFTVSPTGATVRCAKGMRVEADHSFADCPDLDIILIPGGQGTRREMKNPAMPDFVRRQAAKATWITSVCTGALVLVSAGPARGKRVTTHWAAFDELAALDGVGEMVKDQRYVRDGNVVTSAGVSAGIDMALWLTGERFGEQHGRMVQKSIEYDPAPPFTLPKATAMVSG